MKNPKRKRIDIGGGKHATFDVIDLDIHVGDRVWFNDGFKDHPHYKAGKVLSINPDDWWLDKDRKSLGSVDIEVDDVEGLVYLIYFEDVILEDPYKEDKNKKSSKIDKFIKSLSPEEKTELLKKLQNE